MIVYLKSKEEIEGFKEVGIISGKILQSILKEIKPGITTKHLDDVARRECSLHNVTPTFLGYGGFPAAICVSVNDTLVHGIPDDYVLKNKDVVSVDFGATKDGFIGDTAETIWLSEDKEMVLLYDCDPPMKEKIELNIIRDCRFCLDYCIKNYCIAGKKLSEISSWIFQVAQNYGYSVPRDYGGHGIDRYKLHAGPYIPCHTENIQDLTLRPGMVLAIEPMFIKGKGTTKVLEDKWTVKTDGISVHCEHTILITDDKPIILTRREDV
jgi:methionyl aminopeptidase